MAAGQTMHRGFFNNKIKKLLLISIWILIWRHGFAAAAVATASAETDANVNGDNGGNGTKVVIYEDNIDGSSSSSALPEREKDEEEAAVAVTAKDQLGGIKASLTGSTAGTLAEVKSDNEDLKDFTNATTSTARMMMHSIDDAATRTTNNADNVDTAEPMTDDDDDKEEALEQAADEEIETVTEDVVILQQQLIHNFAIKFKQIPRVTYFTCRTSKTTTTTNNNNNAEANKRSISHPNANTLALLKRMFFMAIPTPTTTIPESSAAGNGNGNESGNVLGGGGGVGVGLAAAASAAAVSASEEKQRLPRGILIKVVQIDQLINKRRSNIANPLMNNMQRSSGPLGGHGRGGGAIAGAAGAAAGRNTYTNANWLEQVLRTDTLRQIVVLDLSCGVASRRLLEMASNKALFNSTYHWLLIEDYAFNRQTGIDDDAVVVAAADDDYDSSSNSSNNNNSNVSNVVVVNMKGEQAKNTDIVGGGSGAGTGSGTGAKLLQDNGKTVVGNRQQQQQQRQRLANDAATAAAASAATAAAVDDEDDMEIIEKFLEKINININTELILAKRTRGTGKGCGGASNSNGCGSDSDSSISNNNTTNKTLQKKDYYMLYDVWNPGLQYGGQLNISEIGNFTLDDGFQIASWYRRSTTITRRMDMQLARIRCLIVITHKNRTDTLEHYLTTHYDTHLDSMNRFNFALLSHVRDLYNFSFVLSKTATWGYLKNGKFDGMIGALVRKQADIGGSPIFFRIERAKVIDYTSRTWVARPCFIFRHPRSTKKDRIVFLQPFSNDVWIFLGVCGMMTILLLWLLTSLERRLEAPPNEMDFIGGMRAGLAVSAAVGGRGVSQTRGRVRRGQNNNSAALATLAASADDEAAIASASPASAAASTVALVATGGGCKRRFVRWGNVVCGQDGDDASRRRVGLFLESVLFYIGSICQQGLAFSTSFFSGRCIVITSLLFAFSIYQFYSASIVGTLLMEKPKTIRTLRDLIHTSLEIGIEDIVYNRDFFLRTKDPDAIELYAKKVTSVPSNDEQSFLDDATPPPVTVMGQTAAEKAKSYREILHSHETGAHAKTNEASNWYDPDFGIAKIKKGRFAFHVDVATAYKIISDTFNEKEICDLTEIQLFPPQKMVSIVQKGSPLRKIITYGLRRVTEAGLMDYQRKIWHSPKPRCVKQIHTDDLRVDMQTFTSALLVLIFGYAVSLLALGLEIMHHKLWQRFAAT